MSAWQERIQNAVVPAQVAGLFVYTGQGLLEPGAGVKADYQSRRKPGTLPNWHVYLEGKESGQPDIRFVQLVHKAPNVFGSAWQNYTHRGRVSQLGVSLTLPLGEGMVAADGEIEAVNALMDMIEGRSVRVIGLGRTRFLHDRSAQPFVEPVLMEVYDEDGALLWVNPFCGCTLEDALAEVGRAPKAGSRAPYRVKGTETAEVAAATARMAGVAVAMDKATSLRAEAERHLLTLQSEGMGDADIVAHVARLLSLPIELIERFYADWKRAEATLPDGATSRIHNAFTQAEAFGYKGDDAVAMVVSITKMDEATVRGVLGVAKAAPAPQKGLLAQLAPQVPVAAPAASLKRVQAPKGDVLSAEELESVLVGITTHAADYRAKVAAHMASGKGHLDSKGLRTLLGLPHGTTGPMKRISDSLLRNVLDPLVASGDLKRQGTHPRNTVYVKA